MAASKTVAAVFPKSSSVLAVATAVAEKIAVEFVDSFSLVTVMLPEPVGSNLTAIVDSFVVAAVVAVVKVKGIELDVPGVALLWE